MSTIPHLKVDIWGAKITAQFMGNRLSTYYILASNYPNPKDFGLAVQECYAKAVMLEHLERQEYNYKRRSKYKR